VKFLRKVGLICVGDSAGTGSGHHWGGSKKFGGQREVNWGPPFQEKNSTHGEQRRADAEEKRFCSVEGVEAQNVKGKGLEEG